MLSFGNIQWPPPENWQDFEALCCELWSHLWQDPNTQRNGRQGQPQAGVDIFGRPHNGEEWFGVQCKLKDDLFKTPLTKTEIQSEVDKAKTFQPRLSEFVIATTAPKDVKIQQLVREITQVQLAAGSFPVHIWFWEDIRQKGLTKFPDILKKFYPLDLFEHEEKVFSSVVPAYYQIPQPNSLFVGPKVSVRLFLQNRKNDLRGSRSWYP